MEHHGNAAFRRRQIRDRLIGNADIAAGERLKPGDQPQQGRLATARGANKDHKFAFFNFQPNVANDFRFAECLIHTL